MEIILLESLHKIGKAGEIVTVKDGYANNFLIPNNKAIVANKLNKKTLDSRIVDINKKMKKKLLLLLKNKLLWRIFRLKFLWNVTKKGNYTVL
jgi:ribosomal protein L9